MRRGERGKRAEVQAERGRREDEKALHVRWGMGNGEGILSPVPVLLGTDQEKDNFQMGQKFPNNYTIMNNVSNVSLYQ